MTTTLALLGLWALAPQEAAPAGVKLTIHAEESIFRPGRRMPLRVALENAGSADLKQDEPSDYLEGLEIRDPEGKVFKAVGKTQGITRRTVTLEAGAFIGRVVDVSAAFHVPEDKEGWYTVRWSFGEAVSNEIRVQVARDVVATIETNLGEIEIEFLPQVAPNHVRNFLALARSGFYEGSLFHRIIPGFMMQGGKAKDPSRPAVPTIKAEFNDTRHVFGTVSMARTSDPDSASSQFFICFGAAPHLDRKYTVFAQVTRGDEVVKAVERVKSDHSPCTKCGTVAARPGSTPCCGSHHQDRPLEDVVIKKITVTERKK